MSIQRDGGGKKNDIVLDKTDYRVRHRSKGIDIVQRCRKKEWDK